ncbi:MAG: phosphoserine phosphatase SerB [Alphaproteobacteria bacterium]
MNHVLTLIAGPLAQPIVDASIANIREALPTPGKTIWLAKGEACDIPFELEANEITTIRDRVREALQGAAIDFVCQRDQSRRKRLLVADMDSTLIGQECIDEIAELVGLKPKISAITERAMRGELEFEPALRERVALLKGVDEKALQTIFDNQITLNTGARTLARTMVTHGARAVIVSGGFTYFTSRIAEAAGFDANQANELEIEQGKLTGRVIEPILGQQAKLEALCHYRKIMDIDRIDTLCVGDGANDLAMLSEAGLGVAYHAKPVVAAKAHARVNHGDLTALLFAQGYTRDEFVED